MSPPVTRPTRRAVLRAASTGAVLAAAAPLVGACARAPEGPDALEPLLAAARDDAARADAAGATGAPSATGEVARVRRAHADALAAEIRRARPDRRAAVDAVVAGPVDPAVAAPVTAAGAGGATALVVAGLAAARDTGAALAPGTTRYRCGLLASVAAACGALVTTLDGAGS